VLLGSLIQQYLGKNAGEDREMFRRSVRALVKDIDSSGIAPTPGNAALFVGSLIAGIFKHFDAIRADDAARWQMLVSLDALAVDLDGAGDWRLALAPLVQAKDGQPPGKGLVYRALGQFKTAWMSLGEAPRTWTKEDVAVAVQLLDATLESNGF
jgi:hypothetical protein